MFHAASSEIVEYSGFSALWGAAVLDVFVDEDVLPVQVSNAHCCVAIAHAVVAGEPSGSTIGVSEMLPVHAEGMKTVVAIIAKVQPFSAFPPFLAVSALPARFFDVSVAVGCLEWQGDAFFAAISRIAFCFL